MFPKLLLFLPIILVKLSDAVILEPYSLDSVISGQYIVKLKSGINSQLFVSSHSLRRDDNALSPLSEDVEFVYSYAFNGFSAKLDNTQLLTLDAMFEVEYIELDVVVSVDATVTENTQQNATWGLARLSTKTTLRGGNVTNSQWNFNYLEPSGSCAVVYVIDTGINTAHVDFEGRAHWGESFIPGTTQEDDNGHGTHVAGTIGGRLYGIAKNVELISVKTLGQNGSSVGSGSSTLAGIDWATNNATSRKNRKPTIFNMSFTNVQLNATMDAVNNAIDRGITVVAGAGNNNNDSCLISPAMTPRAITVAASNILDQRATFSNYGPCVDVYAPGVNITSAWIGSSTDIRMISGTSMATPHVAGLAADYICRFNLQTPAEVDAKIKQIAISDTIQYLTPVPLETRNLLIHYGYGINELINCGVSKSAVDNRIIGGAPATRGQFPWQAYVQTRRNNFWSFACGASILNDYWILTAAHCVYGLTTDNVRVVVGADYIDSMNDVELKLSIANITIHESYDPMLLTNDIALLKVASNINTNFTNGYINGVCLPEEGQKFTQYLTLSGWGYSLYNSGITSNKLMYANNIPIISLPKCRSIYGNNAIRDGMLCAGGEDGGLGSCQGDSGGPLIQSNGNGRYILVGISSFSLGCAQPGIPGVYVEISYYRDWIDQYAV